ncbi:hypothetical protein DICVIV_04747 [Dictyocaulus viviparus]|uniref:M protein repeat protein n=1 Tax=Dictyocaulus viviparus TaxID=29172 RepID=A0A0D8XZ30_DICVI|nr:hypothetical protein DICVIV_04747 [Dictyocaulus viviparus]
MEKELEEDRRKSSDRVNKLKELIRLKEAGASETRKQLEEVTAQLADKNLLLREKEYQIEESRQKIEDSITRIADAELKARKLVRIHCIHLFLILSYCQLIFQEEELSQCETERVSKLDLESELQYELQESQTALSFLKQQVEQLNMELNARDQALQSAAIELDGKEEHWKKKREEFEQQLEKNNEHYEELLSAMKTLQTSFEMEKKGNVSRQVEIDKLTDALNVSSSRITELTTELETSKELLKGSEESVEELKHQLDEEKHRLEIAQKNCEKESVENALCDARMELDTVQKNSTRQQAELMSAVERVELEKVGLLNDLEGKQQEILRLSDLNTQLKEDITTKKNELDGFQERMVCIHPS